MKRSWAENAKAAALALTVAMPMSYILQISTGIWLPCWYAVLFSVMSVAFLELVNHNKWTAIGIPAILLLGCGYAWLAFGKDQRQFFTDYYWWVVGFLYNSGSYTLGQATALTAGTTFLATLLVWLFGRRFFCFPAVLAFVVSFLLFKWLQGFDLVLLPGTLACGGLLLLWAKSILTKTAKKTGQPVPANGIALYLLPLAALIAVLSFVGVPDETAQKWQNRDVYNMFERINNYVADYTGFTRPRHAFSIASYGFMPMGTRLGGPVSLSDDKVLRVTAPKRILLRGVVYNSYESNHWADTTTSQGLRFSNANKAAADNTFDIVRPQLTGASADDFRRYVQPYSIHIQPLVDSSSTMFAPFRGISGVSSDKFLAILPKFNAKGEVFSSSDLHAGYGYTVQADYLNYTGDGFGDMMGGLLSLNLKDTDSQAQAIRQYYTALPEGIAPDVYTIVHNIVSGNPMFLLNDSSAALDNDIPVVFTGVIPAAATVEYSTVVVSIRSSNNVRTKAFYSPWTPPPASNDYEKALAIKKFLTDNYKYTLDPTAPPETADFVSWFIDNDPKGYCTYFASAMAVMARIAGIPSRYVEGYMLPEKDPGDTAYTVRCKDAHAWAELYFEGVGWIPFDATPASQGPDENNPGNSAGPEPIPTPSIPPYDIGGDDEGSGNIGKAATWDDFAFILWLLPVIICGVVLAWVAWKMIAAKVKANPRYLAGKYPDARRRCAYLYVECVKMLGYYNYRLKTGETLFAYAARIDKWLRLESGTFMQVAELISKLSYSDYAPTDADAAFIAAFRTGLAKYTYRTVGPWFYLNHQVLGFKVRESRPRRN